MTTQKKTLDELRNSVKQLAWPREHRERGRVELRAVGDGRTLEMFIPFESESVDMGFRERIHPSAFTRSIKTGRKERDNDIRALWSHDSSKPLARQANKTLDFDERSDGLVASATLAPDTYDYHRDALNLVKDGLVTGTSFGFETVRDEWEYDEDGEATRTLLEVRLYEVSPVVFPAYQASGIEARTAIAARASGLDVSSIVQVLQEVRDGKCPAGRRDAVLAMLAKLQGMVPDIAPAPVESDDYWERKLASRERLLGKVA